MKTARIMILCVPLLVAACKGKKTDLSTDGKETAAAVIESRRAPGAPKDANELKSDFMGTFSGTLPCADCSGILTTLTLNADGTYMLESTYQGKGDGQPFVEQGKWTPSEDLAFIELNYDVRDKSVFYALIDKNTLEKLDQNAKPISSEANRRLIRKP